MEWRGGSLSLFLGLILTLFFVTPSAAQATTAQEYISTGEGQLFSETVDGVLQAYTTFVSAHADYPDDPVINAYLALTRIFNLGLTDDSGALTDLLGQFGISRTGNNLDTLDLDIPLNSNGDLILPETSPSGEAIRSFLAGPLLTALNASISNLDTTLSYWTDKHIIPKATAGTDYNIEVDNGDIYLFRAMLKFAKTVVLIVTSYDLDVDIREIAALINIDAFNSKDFLQRYQNLLNLLTTSSTPSVDGADQLTQAKAALLGAIDDYLTASDKIRNDTDTATGAEELITLSPDDEADEQLLRDNLTELKASLNESRAADLITERNGTEEKHLSLNLNPLFGNGSGPYNLRDFLPDFNCDGEPGYETMGYGLDPSNPDATLGGIFPDFTQDDWGLEGIMASGEIAIPQATINVQDDSLVDWAGIAPVFQDITGDGDPNHSGSDLQDLYLAKDGTYLYGRMTLADGPPNTAVQANPWEAMGYSVEFELRSSQFVGGRTMMVDYTQEGKWRVQVWEEQEGYQSQMLATYVDGYAEAVGNDLEWKVPLADLGSINGRFIYTWIQWLPYTQAPSDDNETCLRIGPLSSISGTLNVPDYDGDGPLYIWVYQSENGVFNPDPKNLLGMDIIYPEEYSAGMSYIVDGLPVGEQVFVAVRWDADFNGLKTRGDYVGKAGPYTVATDGTTGANLQPATMYAADKETPYFSGCNVMAMNTPDGVSTALTVKVSDPNGTVPDTITSISVTGPGGFAYSLAPADYYEGFKVYWHGISGQPTVGEYTFTVTDTEGKTATNHYYFGGGTNIPVPDESTLQASGDPLAPTLSWGAVSGYDGNLFYRARIFDATDYSIVWTSDFTAQTSVKVSSGVLVSGTQYKWRVEAFDNYTYFASNQRAVTNLIFLTTDDSTPYFNWATVFHRHDTSTTADWTQIEVNVVDPDGDASSTLKSLEVYDPQDVLLYTFKTTDYYSGFQEYYTKLSGTPAEGVYKFVVTDADDNTKTTYDYVAPSFDIPLVDSATLQASGDSLAPTLSWGAPANMDRPIYFRVIVEDMEWNRVWASNRISGTSIQVPSGKLQSGGSYQWYVRTIDDPNWVHFSNQGRSEKVGLGLDNSTPFFNWTAVYQRHDPDGVHTAFDAGIVDPDGTLPGSLQSLTVTDPNSNTYDLFTNGQYNSYWTDFFLRVSGAPAPGAYTFTVVDNEGKTAVTRDWVGESTEIPIVEQSSIAVTGDPLAPTLSWSGISGYQGNLYYRIWVQDTDGNFIYMSPREPYTAQTIPEGKLQAGKTYLARVEAQDNNTWAIYNSRSNSGWVLLSTEGTYLAPVSGDINGDYSVTLADAVIALQVVAGMSPGDVALSGSVNGNGKIGLAEAIYALQTVAGLR